MGAPAAARSASRLSGAGTLAGARCAAWVVLAAALAMPLRAATPGAAGDDQLILRGRMQTLRLYGDPAGQPVIVASGDGGWIHVAPHVAEWLAARGCRVVGVDSRAYLSSFTSGGSTLTPSDVPGDFAAIVARAGAATGRKPALLGVSEGAGLAVMAAADPVVQQAISGVIVLGMPDMNELGWRWTDAVVYVTHGVPKEPLFSAAEFVGHVAPLPVAGIYAAHDEFVSDADRERLTAAARDPKRFWTVAAGNHRFSDNLTELDARLADAMAWVAGRGR
jgi:hypothetical protein